jgi:hypothetical protein
MPEIKPRIVTFYFDDAFPEYDGIKVEMRVNPTMKTFWDWAKADMPAEIGPARQYIIDFAAITLVNWNLEEGGEPVPATPENFADYLDMSAARSLVRAVANQIGRVEGPLALPSLNGSTSKARRGSRSRRSSPK